MPELFLLNKDTELSYVLERYEEKTGMAPRTIRGREKLLNQLECDLQLVVDNQPEWHILIGHED